MRTERRGLGLCAAAMALLLASSAAAQQPADPPSDPESAARAERLFHEGVALLEEGRFESARAVLAQALEYEARASTGFNLASALHALERHWEAHRLLERIDRGELGPLPEGYAGPAAQLRQALDGALGRLELRLISPAEVTVSVDGEPAGGLVRGSTIRRTLPAGAHVVEADAEGFAGWRREVTLDAGQLERLSVELLVESEALSEAPAAPPEESGDDAGLWIGLGVGIGVVLAVGAIVLGVVLSPPACDPVVGCIEF